ncbi:MAG: ROK family transcriptional regulator [Caldilineaceae bacterium]|nr:ROK family transcriptional regulator [Caldilineaceae bacterium]
MITVTAKATHAQTRRHNNRLVLKTVYDQGPLSRAAIARSTNLTATTVSTVIAELLEDGLVEEIGAVSTERGKPPTLVTLVKDARHIVGLDLSRHRFQASILNLRGEIQESRQIPVDGAVGDAAQALVYQLIDEILPLARRPLLGIGVGAPGIIDRHHHIIRHAVNLSWENVPLGQSLNERYGLHVQVVNDNQAVLLAEFLFGAYKSTPDMVVVRVGNGIGAGILCNGQLVHGNGTGVGEIGHVVVVEEGEWCSCGNRGCLETVASSRAIVKLAKAIAAQQPTSYLHVLTASPEKLLEKLTIDQVIAAFQAGDPSLQPIVQQVGRHLGSMIANLVSVLGMPRILLCGSVTGFGTPLLDVIRAEVRHRALSGRINEPQIDLVSLTTDLSDLVIMGAAATLLANELGLFL